MIYECISCSFLWGRMLRDDALWEGRCLHVMVGRGKRRRKPNPPTNSIPHFPFQVGGTLALELALAREPFAASCFNPTSGSSLTPLVWLWQRLSQFLTKWAGSMQKLLSAWACRQRLSAYLGGWRKGDNQAIWLTESCNRAVWLPQGTAGRWGGRKGSKPVHLPHKSVLGRSVSSLDSLPEKIFRANVRRITLGHCSSVSQGLKITSNTGTPFQWFLKKRGRSWLNVACHLSWHPRKY